MKILLVEDDKALQRRLKENLKKASFVVDAASDGIDAEHLGMEIDYDVVILDLGLPGKAGLDVLTSWRDQGRLFPVIILTARDAWYERVDGLRAGADDYLGKPFHFEELLLRLRALTRRHQQDAPMGLSVGDYDLDDEQRMLIIRSADNQQTSIELTRLEYRLLRYFIRHPGIVLSKSRLIEQVYENDTDRDSNVIEVYINRLRKKIGKHLITTRRGQGYVYQDSGLN